MSRPAKLALIDGTVFEGRAFGASGEIHGEVVFNTSMTGYQEILTDPSYCGQIVTMTYPLIGNYGINVEDVESGGLSLRGFIVKELCRHESNYRSSQSLDSYLAKHGVIGIEGLDTRALVRRIRIHGAMTGIISTEDLDNESLIAKAKKSPELAGQDLAREVIPSESAGWSEGLNAITRDPVTLGYDGLHSATTDEGAHVVAIDYGMKWNIPRHLKQLGCKVTIVPGTWSAEQILELSPAGNQLLGLACGAEIFKMRFGHRGANQPVLDKGTGKVEITSQNHGFALDAASMPSNLEVTHINLNDQTVEGIRHRDYPAFAVQYHPEASAGPHDSHYLFGQFREMLLQHV